MKALLAALLLLPVCAFSENFNKETRDFSSGNKVFRLAVSYSGTGGAGRARAVLTGAGGKKISSFETDRPPFSVTLSGDGRRLFFFCGSWGQAVSIFSIDVYSSAGERLASHQVRMDGPAGEDFSEDYSVYALGTEQGGSRAVLLFDSGSGRLLWTKKTKERLAGLKLSGDGNRLLALFSGEGGDWRPVIYDKAGRELGRAELTGTGHLAPRVFSRDGGAFELWEDRTVYDKKDGYFHARLVKKRYFRVAAGGIEPAGVKDFNEVYR
ncbi:MAG: hypothetical protein PHV33_06575 [Elusimicrobiales bacterium]|nr:hypothetical protein [Elusimicrobiales bacterium]